MSKKTLFRTVSVPKAARRDTLYDTQELVQGQGTVNFYPAQANRNIAMANYTQNPLPGTDAFLIYGLSFGLTKQHIKTDAANDIDAERIINAVKFAGVEVTADQNSQLFLKTRLSDHFNFEGTHLNAAVALAGQAAADDQQSSVDKTVTQQAADLYRVPDPFILAPNQVLDVKVQFGDASIFPTSANWTDGQQGKMYMRSKLYGAYLTQAMQEAMKNS